MIVEFHLVQGDVLEVPSDLLLLKYAQRNHGIDAAVATLIKSGGPPGDAIQPAPNQFVLVPAPAQISARNVLFVGTPPIDRLGYEEMHHFARRAIEIIAQHRPHDVDVTTTVHGVGYGLDAGEAAQHLVLGFLAAGMRVAEPTQLRRITFVERDASTFRSISTALSAMGIRAGSTKEPATTSTLEAFRFDSSKPQRELPRLPEKEHVFVAIPFSEHFEDVYEFGIYEPVRRCGYICERVDQTSFTGDVLERIRSRIQLAKFVVADLTEARPNVYLEVGYAWGRDVPVIFLAKGGEALHFDVKTHRCIYYKTIKQLARDLEKLIEGLYGSGEK